MIANCAIAAARLLFAGAFLVAAIMKLLGMEGTASAIASIGLPFPLLLAWLAALFEIALVAALLTGAFFAEAAGLAAAYVLFLGFAFYGPASWSENPMQMGLFLNHLTFVAGLLFAAVHGPGRLAAPGGTVHWGVVGRSVARRRDTDAEEG